MDIGRARIDGTPQQIVARLHDVLYEGIDELLVSVLPGPGQVEQEGALLAELA